MEQAGGEKKALDTLERLEQKRDDSMEQKRDDSMEQLQRKGLKQYQRRESIAKGSGDMICMLDESGSAEEAAPWCKAVALALLDIALQGNRRFAMIHFAGVGHFQTDLFLPGQYDREDVLRAAETFLNGNTDYATPLNEALRLMEIVFANDLRLLFLQLGHIELQLFDAVLQNVQLLVDFQERRIVEAIRFVLKIQGNLHGLVGNMAGRSYGTCQRVAKCEFADYLVL